MSVTASSANVDPPPLLFGQRSPSPPAFSPPPQSPNHLQRSQTPVSSPPRQPTNDDINMSTSTTSLPPHAQNHDREDALMAEPESLANGHLEPQFVAVEVAAIDEDVMDITPDQGLVLPNASVAGEAVPSDAPNGIAQEDSGGSVTPLGNIEAAGSVEVPPALAPSDVAVASGIPPPRVEEPPPPPNPAQADSDSSDEEDGSQPWHPIHEDTSVPDEIELKEIEDGGVEFSALDHKHWEERAFPPLEEPEYTPGESGRLEWLVENYNGTREKPNRDVVMKSPLVNIGGYEWQIKFYPKGNDSDYLSVYVECLSVGDKDAGAAETVRDAPGEADAEGNRQTHTEAPNAKDGPADARHAPLPLLDTKSIPKRKSVAAQVSVVLYNPEEPRVNYVRTCLHRFCTGSPDWGWTRYHGPYYDIPHRQRGQRQALLRNDKLAFTGYIRIINDETESLWEHHSRDNPWDSFAMTGLQALTLGEGASTPGGNMISAVASWLLFKPFRQFLYHFTTPDPEKDPYVQPKPLLAAFQKVLFLLRTQVDTGAGPVGMDDVLDALEWYGIHDRLDKLDVIEIWEVLRYKLEHELKDTQHANILDNFFGTKKDYASNIPSYRVPVLGVQTMQGAVDQANNLLHPSQPLPQFLSIELDRQYFDHATRSYVKLMNKVTLDDNIDIRGVGYTLYGFVVHRQTLQSYLYHPVLRPEGPGSKWYNYTDGKEENMVKILTQRQAVAAHEGTPSSDKVIGNDAVAYIAMYVRNDVAKAAFTCDAETEKWDVPEWIRNDIEKSRASNRPPSPPSILSPVDAPKPAEVDKQEDEPTEEAVPPEVHEFQVIDSRVFLEHEGPGTFDAYDAKWQASQHVRKVQLTGTDSRKEIRDKLAATVEGIKDPRQVKFWFLDALRGTFAKPNLLGVGKIEFSSGSTDHYADESKRWSLNDYRENWAAYRIWIHVIDYDALPELPKEEPKPKTPEAEQVDPARPTEPGAQTQLSNDTSNPTEAPQETVRHPAQAEDTPMSEPDEPAAEAPPQPPADAATEAPSIEHAEESAQVADTPMFEVEVEVAMASAPPADPPAVDVIIPNPSAPTPADTEMGGTQEDLPPPPPPPGNLQIDPIPPPAPPIDLQQDSSPPPIPAPVQTIPDEIYFFLKFFDADAQTFVSKGTHVALKAARVDNTVIKLLNLPPEQKVELFEEEDITTTHPIRNRRSFAQNDLHNTAIIIATIPLTEEQRDALAARAAFADLQLFLAYRANSRNFPAKMTGHFELNYFSSQYYKGEIKNGHQHGHGTRIYHSGATYSGSFRLGRRHGHGLYTFQNGDTYDGDWVADQQHGTGTHVEAATGNTYVGGWKNDKRFGEGVTHWKQAQETERLCRICWEEAAEAAFYDCGHVVACLGCARRVDTCPVCRKRVLSAMKLYYVA